MLLLVALLLLNELLLFVRERRSDQGLIVPLLRLHLPLLVLLQLLLPEVFLLLNQEELKLLLQFWRYRVGSRGWGRAGRSSGAGRRGEPAGGPCGLLLLLLLLLELLLPLVLLLLPLIALLKLLLHLLNLLLLLRRQPLGRRGSGRREGRGWCGSRRGRDPAWDARHRWQHRPGDSMWGSHDGARGARPSSGGRGSRGV